MIEFAFGLCFRYAQFMDPNQNNVSTESAQKSQDYVRAEEFRKYIETEVLKIIKDLAEKGSAPPEKLQNIARLVLELIKPGMSIDELYRNAVKLDDQYYELAPIVMKIMREYEEKHEKKALIEVSQLIKLQKFDEAQNMVKKVLQFKVNQ